MSWTHIPEMQLIDLTSKGLTKFLDPRYGRVKAFPNQGSEGNFSIRIDDIENSDMGCYRCRQGKDCFQVELVSDKGKKDSSINVRTECFVSSSLCRHLWGFFLSMVTNFVGPKLVRGKCLSLSFLCMHLCKNHNLSRRWTRRRDATALHLWWCSTHPDYCRWGLLHYIYMWVLPQFDILTSNTYVTHK